MRRHARSLSALIGFVAVGLVCAGNAFASSASPNPVNFGNVPINTTVSSTVTITVDSGYRTEVASGSGLNAPFAFDFGSFGTGGGFTGPGTCTVSERYTPTAGTRSRAASSNGTSPRTW